MRGAGKAPARLMQRSAVRYGCLDQVAFPLCSVADGAIGRGAFIMRVRWMVAWIRVAWTGACIEMAAGATAMLAMLAAGAAEMGGAGLLRDAGGGG